MKRTRYGLYPRNQKFCFRYQDTDGRWREKSTLTDNIREARKYKEEFERNPREGTLPTDKAAWSVKQAAALWVQQHAAHLGPAKSKRNEQSLLNQLTRRIGDVKLKAVTIDKIKDYQVARRKEVSERTINLELRILQNVLREANLWHPIEKHYKPLREQTSEVGQALTQEQLARLEATAASNPAWEVAYRCEVLASNTGMRGCEIRRLQLADVNLELRRLRIRRQGTKTDSGCRLIELNQAALEAATRLFQRAQLIGAAKPEHYLLPCDRSRHTRDIDPLKGIGFDPANHQQTWRTAWRRLRKAAGLDGLRFHSLRHSFISAMAERNVPLAVVQAMAGHMSAAMTRHYTHISSQAARNAVELLDKPRFVDGFVDGNDIAKQTERKLLN